MPPSTGARTGSTRLTDAALRAAKAADKTYKIAAGGGLYLEVTTTGSKLWRWKYRIAGKENRYAIGSYPSTSLVEARNIQEEARKLVKTGVHPSHNKQLKRINQATEHANTFEAVAREWITANAVHWTTRTGMQRQRALEADVFPYIGGLPIRQVAPAHVLDIVKRVEKRAPAMATIVNQAISAICRLAVVTLRADVDPTNPIRGALKPPKTKHHRPLAPSEIPKLIAANEASASYYPNKAALKLMLLTLARTMEILGARWDEFDLEAGLWIVPAARMKMREEHLIPLPMQAVELLQKLRVLAGDLNDAITGLPKPVFPNRNQPSRPASEGVLWKAISRMGFDERFSPHGIRSTGSTLLNEMGFRSDLIEKQLAHEERDKSRKSYNRATYLDDRREMMQQWADYMDSLKQGSTVIPMNARRSA